MVLVGVVTWRCGEGVKVVLVGVVTWGCGERE